MKKLMIAASAAAFVGAALAAELSSGVVGYQGRALGVNQTIWCCGTFQATSKTQDAMTLGDITPANDAGNCVGEVTLSFYSPKAANLKLTAKDTENFVGSAASFIYFSQQEIDDLKAEEGYEGELDDVVAGWYHEDDMDEWTECFNSYVVPYGSGYGVKESAKGYSLVYSGTVVKDADMPSVTLAVNQTIWTGNAAPTDMKLQEFVPSNEDGNCVGEVTLSLYSPKAANYKLTEDETENFVGSAASFIYFSQQEIDDLKAEEGYEGELDDVVAGWYHEDDMDEWTECFNNYVIPAGSAFGVKASAKNYSLDLPGAL